MQLALFREAQNHIGLGYHQILILAKAMNCSCTLQIEAECLSGQLYIATHCWTIRIIKT